MEGKITKISYNEKDDILFIYKNGKVKGNIMIGGFVVDISYRNDFIGIEVLNASENLKVFNITKEMMKYAKKAKIISKKYQDGTIFVGFELFSAIPNKREMEERAIVAIPEISRSEI
ncbi:MAG: DUF2283 domain-containing protein [Nanoarchaeota archaeon]|nr:DUF2283 domain-containing protein [Nanoarchaeota archaeon]MBU1444758.1 DUF2283 domain-containing protein [Nanoarchaeota archaeon]MBU2406686.1 DUF2283 domain-containing protein [Nanoarchaeota archaeon]MBU2420121.1 DUF2283 domain-containing protein [Nanoarchaeota archaeon]MBU2474887.1 DUF2283 domain-containing protein [Nanoarchaeota archaeon]